MRWYFLLLLLPLALPVSSQAYQSDSDIVLQDQQMSIDNTFLVPSLVITEPYVFLVVHTNYGSSPDPLDGAVGASRGNYTDFVFPYKPLQEVTTIWIMLHNDTDGNRNFAMNEDVALFDRNNDVIVSNVTLTPAPPVITVTETTVESVTETVIENVTVTDTSYIETTRITSITLTQTQLQQVTVTQEASFPLLGLLALFVRRR